MVSAVAPYSLVVEASNDTQVFIFEDGGSRFVRNVDEHPPDIWSGISWYVTNRQEEATRKQLKLVRSLNGEIFKSY